MQQTKLPNPMNIGLAIKTLRSARGLTQKELAHASSLSVAYVCQIENNLKEPPISTLQQLSTAVGIPLSLVFFLASDASELAGVSQDVHEKLSSSIVNLLKGLKDAPR